MNPARWAVRRLAAWLVCGLAWLGGAPLHAQVLPAGVSLSPTAAGWLERTPEDAADLRSGAALYQLECAVCHGGSGLGFAEAKLAFPEAERTCTRCHRPSNPPRVDWLAVHDTDMFSLGEPPALRGAGTLARFASDDALFAYLRATMPRYAGSPGGPRILQPHRVPAGAKRPALTLMQARVSAGWSAASAEAACRDDAGDAGLPRGT